MILNVKCKSFEKKNYTYNTSFNIIPKKRLLSVRDAVVKDVEKLHIYGYKNNESIFIAEIFYIWALATINCYKNQVA